MATAKKVLTMEEMAKQSAELDKQEGALDNKVGKSDSFWGESAPSGSALKLDVQKRTLASRKAALESNMAARKAYGEENAADSAAAGVNRPGLIGGAIDVLSRPLYGVVGAAKYAAGKGESTLGESVMKNVGTTKDTFGSLLRQIGVSPKISAPLGFGLDVIADPVNLLSGGLVGLGRTGVGKVGVGMAKAGVAGAIKGAETSALDIAARAASFIPGVGVNKKLFNIAKAGIDEGTPEFAEAIRKSFYPSEKGIGKVVGDFRTGVKNLYKKTAAARDQYDEMVGFDMKKVVENRAERDSIADKMKSMLVQLPGGDKLVDFFEYNSNKWTQNAKLWNATEKAFASIGQKVESVFDPATGTVKYPSTEEIASLLQGVKDKALAREAGTAMADAATDATPRFLKYKNKEALMGDLTQAMDDGIEILKSNKGEVEVRTALEAKDAMLQELRNTNQWNDINDAFRKMVGAQDMGAVDKARDWMEKKFVLNPSSLTGQKKIEAGKKLLKFYDVAMGLFKSAKISSLSPASMVYAILGNGTMQHMSGINMLRPEVYNRLKDAAILLTGGKFGGEKAFSNLVGKITSTKENAALAEFWVNHSDLAKQSFGLSAFELGAKTTADDIVNGLTSGGYFGGKMSDQAKDELYKEIYGAAENARVRKLLESGHSLEQLKEIGNKMGSPTGILANELGPHKAFIEFKENIAKRAAQPGNNAAKALNFALNRTQDFEMTDQVWKLQNFLLLTQDGVSERELLKLTNNFMTTTARVNADDIAETIVKNGEKFYKIAPEKALEIANETFMNYAAMPGFVKVVRSLPVLGSPFFSFTYAMLQKTGKTMLNNPAAFNQVNFLIKEMEKDKSPLERAALKSKYYKWLDTPGMVNLGENVPFFKGHPLYVNLSQMIPYYSLNILNPSTRRFNDNIRGNFASVLDKSPLMKDPAGQLLMDYVVLPSLLYDETPKNMFGGQLYPEGTSFAGKVGLAARSGAEAFLPSGVAVAGMAVPDSLKPLLPSYPAKKLGYASEGKTSMGVQTKEDPAAKGLRALLGIYAGVNLYPVDLTMIASEVKKSKSK